MQRPAAMAIAAGRMITNFLPVKKKPWQLWKTRPKMWYNCVVYIFRFVDPARKPPPDGTCGAGAFYFGDTN